MPKTWCADSEIGREQNEFYQDQGRKCNSACTVWTKKDANCREPLAGTQVPDTIRNMKILFRGRLHPYLGERMEPLISKPEFSRAWEMTLRHYCHYSTTTAASKSNTIPNEFLGSFIVYMHARREFASRERGATIGELMALAMRRGIYSPRTVTQMVQRFEDEGKVIRASHERDQRLRSIVPTSKLIKEKMEFVQCFVAPLPLIGMGHNATQDCAEDERLFLRVIYEAVALFLEGYDTVRPFPDVHFLESRVRGTLFAAFLHVENLEALGQFTPDVPFVMTLPKAAEVLSVSRSHVRNLIEAFEQRGLITYQGTHCCLTPRFIREFGRALACTHIYFDLSIGRALGYLAGEDHPIPVNLAENDKRPHDRA